MTSKMLIRRAAWFVAVRFGERGRRWVWNDQFRAGWWDGIAGRKSSITVSLAVKYANGGRIVELGCGEAVLLDFLEKTSYSHYLGVDISEVAIEKARARGNPHTSFSVARLEDWEGEAGASLILIEEALYYLTPKNQESLLRRCFHSLAPAGALLVVVHDPLKHKRTLETARSSGRVVEEIKTESRVYVVLKSGDSPAAVGDG